MGPQGAHQYFLSIPFKGVFGKHGFYFTKKKKQQKFLLNLPVVKAYKYSQNVAERFLHFLFLCGPPERGKHTKKTIAKMKKCFDTTCDVMIVDVRSERYCIIKQ